MNRGDYIPALLRSTQTVFSLKDIALLWRCPISNTFQVRVNYYVKMGQLIHVRRGLYSKDKNYSRHELATKIHIPAYVSFETVLAQAGVVFQFYNQIFAASYLTREVTVDGQRYSFRKIKDFALTNPAGIENKDNCSIATVERAFLDTAYLNKEYHFDNLSPLNWDKVFDILQIYQNKRMEKFIQALYKDFKAGE